MAETSLTQLKYSALKDALLYARGGMIPQTEARLSLAKDYSSQLGVPLAQTVEKRIRDVLMEGVRTADPEFVHYNLMLEKAKGRSAIALMNGNLTQLNIALNDEWLYRSRLDRAQERIEREREYQRMKETAQRRKELELIHL